ncbi:hypothetical protein M9194_05300 [Vibrio sp. S4M6]|uniref:hypothetical protein n=1 Tax=Vibrio sinus TaxID=2946865 RepID=UPI00202A5111|nr:hypothetical protein [Vibrio sinus]MCL9780856.1 hypothetical protein [Vibrio sinus]
MRIDLSSPSALLDAILPGTLDLDEHRHNGDVSTSSTRHIVCKPTLSNEHDSLAHSTLSSFERLAD